MSNHSSGTGLDLDHEVPVSQARIPPKGTEGKWDAWSALQLRSKKLLGSAEEAGGGGAVTAMVAEADLVESALLVAVSVAVPVVEGAVYKPDELTLPSEAFHVTVVSEAVP